MESKDKRETSIPGNMKDYIIYEKTHMVKTYPKKAEQEKKKILPVKMLFFKVRSRTLINIYNEHASTSN